MHNLLQGSEYVSMSGKDVPKKEFVELSACCSNLCFQQIEIEQQKAFFSEFWELGDYQAQNVLIKCCMKRSEPKAAIENRDNIRFLRWTYLFPLPSSNIPVCKVFFCNVIGITKNRIFTVQQKIISDSSLKDQRGKHDQHVVKLTETVKTLILVHCESIPHKPSHYKREETTLNYFVNAELTLTQLYSLFVEYYQAVTGILDIPLDETTYTMYFNKNIPFSFTVPRVDVCNICFENENLNSEQEVLSKKAINEHKNLIKSHAELKKELLLRKNELILEFDYAQNLPLPKIPVTEQFYRRLLWLHLFNIHVHNTERSYMFPMLEGFSKKGANTVSNCLFYVIKEECKISCVNKLVLLSDACGGQNRNYTVFSFFSLLSEELQIEIEHVFPVRGHSYCQCDRNFGLYGQKKRKEVIETAEEYVRMIKNSKKPNFIIVSEEDCTIKDYENILKNVNIPKQLQISKAVKIVYYPNGSVDVHSDYSGSFVTYQIEKDISFENLKSASLSIPVGLNPDKLKDIKSLYHYLSKKGKTFFNNYFAKVPIKKK